MKKKICFAAIALAAATSTAHADDDVDWDVEKWANLEANLSDGTSPEWLAQHRIDDGKACDAYAKKVAKKKGVAVMYRPYDHPDAKQVGERWHVPYSKVGWICDRWRARLDVLRMVELYDYSREAELMIKNGPSEDQQKARTDGEWLRKLGAECVALHAEMTAAGQPGTTAIRSTYDQTTLDEMGKRCGLLDEQAKIYDQIWEKNKPLYEKPFVEAGAKGDKLDWLIGSGPGIDLWYVKGCKEPKNVKHLLKQSVWFQWRTDAAGLITILRVQFKGDKEVKVTEKTFLTEAKAYKACK